MYISYGNFLFLSFFLSYLSKQFFIRFLISQLLKLNSTLSGDLQIGDDMEEKLMKLGVNRRNVKTLIRVSNLIFFIS